MRDRQTETEWVRESESERESERERESKTDSAEKWDVKTFPNNKGRVTTSSAFLTTLAFIIPAEIST